MEVEDLTNDFELLETFDGEDGYERHQDAAVEERIGQVELMLVDIDAPAAIAARASS